MAGFVNRALSYFDLQSAERDQRKARGMGEGGGVRNLTVIPQYLALVLGIIIQPYLAAFQTTGDFVVTFESFMKWTLFALIVGILIFPGVYRKAFDPDQPRFVQFCAIVATGVGWKALFTVVMKAGEAAV